MIERLGYKNVVALVYIGALFMQIMDATIINVALPTLAEEFNADPVAMDWTVLSFTLAVGVMTPTAGWIGDKFGLKNTFLAALGGFVAASALCAAAQSLDQLVIARFIQGGFAGMITPAGSAMLFNAFPIAERADAARKVITVAVIAPAIGPLVGGLIVQYFSWRWIFLVNVPIGGLAFAFALWHLRPTEPTEAGRFDISGFILAGTGLSLFLYGISRVGERGWDSPLILVSLVGGVLLLGLLVYVELSKDKPLLPFRMFSNHIFGLTNLLALPVYAAFVSLIYLLPLFLQNVSGLTPFQAGLALFPQPVGIIVATQVMSRVYKRVGPRRLICGGALSAMIVGIAISRTGVETNIWNVRGLMFLRGISMGVLFIPIQSAVYAQIKPQEMSRATAIFGTTRQVAPALGVALGSTILAANISTFPVASYQRAMFYTALLFGLAAVIGLFIRDEDASATMAG